MAPNLAASQHELIHDMIVSKSLKTDQMADIAGCSPRSVKVIRSNLRYFGTTRAPFNGGGRRGPNKATRSFHMFADLVKRFDSLIVIVPYQQFSFQYALLLDFAICYIEL
jgi:hypothetical protein